MYRYSIITGIPNSRRGERVNLGLIVFSAPVEGGLDIRVPSWSKLRCILEGDWENYKSLFIQRVRSTIVQMSEPKELIAFLSASDPVIKFSDLGWFIAENLDAYFTQVDEILSELVISPRATALEEVQDRSRSTRINTEIASAFKTLRILAEKNQSIDDHVVAKDFYVSQNLGLRADFALKNGVYHIASTLDLRPNSVHIKEAAWKSMVLEDARRHLGPDTQRIGVYAASTNCIDQYAPHIALLDSHSDRLYNWHDMLERKAFEDWMRSAVGRSNPPIGVFDQTRH